MDAITVMRRESMEQMRPRPLSGAVVALLLAASLLAAGVSPASAAVDEPDHLPDFSACLGPALESAGFGDTAGLGAEQAIDCLTHYRITQGKSRFVFAPNDLVTRQQMALFLSRAARPAGVRLPDAEDQGFKDIVDLPEEVQDAINRMVELKIMSGASTERFDPGGRIPRRDMALFLAGFLEQADLGEGGTDITKVTSDDSLFEDLSGLPRTVETAVYRLYELGVTKGTSDTAFSPDAPVTRGQMASFITRALSHTNARPSGVTVQAVDTKVVEGEQIDVLISLRDRFHRPIADAYVDLFGVDLDAENPFDRDGTCSSSIQNLGGLLGGLACVIDHADLTTDGFGNAVDAVRIDDSLTLWAWTGAIDEEYDEDKAEARTFVVRTSKPPVDLEITDDMKEGASLLAFDDRITFTLQVVDRDGDPVPVRRTLRVASTIEANGVVKDSESRNYSTDSSGSLTFRFQERDPDKSKNDDVVTLDLDVSVSDLVVRDRTTLGASDGGGDVRVTWSQESAVPTMLRIVQKPVFHVASDEGRGAVNSVQAVLTDQYGDPVRGQRILFSSQDDLGVGEDRYRRHTSSRGIATARYQRDSEYSGVEEIGAEVVGTNIEADPVPHYWVNGYRTGPRRGLYILELDTDLNQFVTADLYAYAYDLNDQFNIYGVRVTLQEFEAAIEERGLTTLDVDVRSRDTSAVNRFDLRA